MRDFEKWGQTDRRTTCAKTMITSARDCGSAKWININFLRVFLLFRALFCPALPPFSNIQSPFLLYICCSCSMGGGGGTVLWKRETGGKFRLQHTKPFYYGWSLVPVMVQSRHISTLRKEKRQKSSDEYVPLLTHCRRGKNHSTRSWTWQWFREKKKQSKKSVGKIETHGKKLIKLKG